MYAYVVVLAGLGLALGATTGCGRLPGSDPAPTGSDDIDEPGPTDDPGPVMARCTDLPFRVLSARGWPGGGVQLTITAPPEASDADGGGAELRIASGDGEPIAVETQPAPTGAGLTMILLYTAADASVHADRVAALLALIDALPAGERIALWVAGASLRLVSDLTRERGRVREKLEALAAEAGAPIDAATLDNLLTRLERAEGEWGAISRNAIHVGGELPATLVIGQAIRHYVLSAGDGPDRDMTYFHGGGVSPAAAGRSVADDIREERAGLMRVGACVESSAGDELEVFWGDAACVIGSVPVVEGSAGHNCDAERVARDDYPFGIVIDLDMTEQQRVVYDAFYTAKSEEDFTATLTLDPQGPTGVRAHFRGHTSLDCARKSLSIDIDGPETRRLAGDFAADEFFLISLCKDDRYFRQILANGILRDHGLFPLGFRVVELRIDGMSRGAYLLLQKPKHALTTRFLSTQAVVRRRSDPNGAQPEIKFPDDAAGSQLARARYDELTRRAMESADDELEAVLGEVLDVDQFLRWVALNTLLENGDYVDEAFFHASANPTSEQPWFFALMGWDMDDLAKACHHQGVNAVSRGNGLMFCAEGHLEKTLLRSDALYDRYVAHLEAWFEILDDAELRMRIERVTTELANVLDHDEACNAMKEVWSKIGDNPGCAVLHDAIRAEAEKYAVRIEGRRVSLGAAIESYRSK